MTPKIPGWGLSIAQFARLQGHPIDLGGAPEFVPDQALSPMMQELAIAINNALFLFAEQQLIAAGPGAQIGIGDPFVIVPPIR